jgi:hypothetical protein
LFDAFSQTNNTHNHAGKCVFFNKTTIYQIGKKVYKIRGSMAIHPLVMQICIITHNIQHLNDPITIQKLRMYHEDKVRPSLDIVLF